MVNITENLAIMGGGPGGSLVALRGVKKGLNVTLFEKGNIRGVCLNKGCIPSKSLSNAADRVYYSENSSKMGIENDLKLDYY